MNVKSLVPGDVLVPRTPSFSLAPLLVLHTRTTHHPGPWTSVEIVGLVGNIIRIFTVEASLIGAGWRIIQVTTASPPG